MGLLCSSRSHLYLRMSSGKSLAVHPVYMLFKSRIPLFIHISLGFCNSFNSRISLFRFLAFSFNYLILPIFPPLTLLLNSLCTLIFTKIIFDNIDVAAELDPIPYSPQISWIISNKLDLISNF